ncbi:MAG: hypothetical protein Q8739_02155 [Candidatus Phytoplasma australasiaticum]|nr:hypothetical protein [Candidatus Phytoplasma australasiaticum]
MVKLKKIIKIINYSTLFLFLFSIININQVIAINKDEYMNDQDNMKIHDIHLENTEDILQHLINKNCYESFSYFALEYPCYNGQNVKYDLIWKIKNPPFKQLGTNEYKLMCVLFDKGERDKKDDIYSLEDLKQMSNGASNMYIFWVKNKFLDPNDKKNVQNLIFNRLELEFKQKQIKEKIKEINELLNYLSQEEKKFSNLENDFKLQIQSLLKDKKSLEVEIINLKQKIKNLEDTKNDENIRKNKQIKELNSQLDLLKKDIQNEKEKYQQLNNYFNNKQKKYSGIRDFLHQNFFRF